MGLKERVRNLCENYGITAQQLEKTLGFSNGYIGKLNTSSPNLRTVQRIAQYFGVSVDFLMTGEDFTDRGRKPQGIPLLGVVRAGVPVECQENIMDYLPFDMPNKEEYFALMVKGNSMEPRMYEGDIVIVHSQPDAENGELVVAKVNGDEACVKKLIKFAHGIALQSLNPSYPLMQFNEEQIASMPVTILGKVKELRARL